MVAEMRDQRLFTRAVFVSQGIVIAVYMVSMLFATRSVISFQVIGAVVYFFVGQYVASPALGSAGVVMKRVCYGLALPGLLVSTVLYAHVSIASLIPRAL